MIPLRVALLGLLLTAGALHAQTVKVSGQSRVDSTMTATGKVVAPVTSRRSRVKWTACLQIDTTSAAWKCSTQTGPWVATLDPALAFTISIPDTVRLWARDQYNAGTRATEFAFCPVFTFGGGNQAVRTAEHVSCAVTVGGITKPPTAAQQAVADAQCLEWHISAGSLTTSQPCDTVYVNGVLGIGAGRRVVPMKRLAEKAGS